MKPLEEIYGKRFFARRHRLSWRAKPVVAAIVAVLKPASVIDVGCGIGDVVGELNRRSIPSRGVEGSPEVTEYFDNDAWDKIVIHDLRKPLSDYLPFDLCLSLEVAEHIEPEYADTYVDNLCQLSRRVLVSAAPPGQGGHYHVNCQPQQYWIRKFYDRGYYYKFSGVEAIREHWEPWRAKKEMSAYYHNLLYFERGERCVK